MDIKKYIPNFFTLANLFSGCVALYFLFQKDFELTFFWVCLGIFFDFFDGFFARLFKKTSPFGLQLDSLADMVTSGVVPGFVMFFLMKLVTQHPYLPFVAFIITLASAYRLAKFNVDTRQTEHFIGLPTPANALLICFLPITVFHYTLFTDVTLPWISDIYVLIGISLLSAWLLNAEINLFSLKIKQWQLKHIKFQLLLVVFSVFYLVFIPYLSVIAIILTYILLSMIKNSTKHA